MRHEVAYYTRMGRGVYNLLRTPRIENPEKAVLDQMANRERHFLETVRAVIFERRENPYFRMFQLAGCNYGDLRRGVEREGLESTLASLHRAGVYLTHDEFKCKKPIVRAGQTIPASAASFLNALVSGFYESRSGGSRSSGTVTRQNLINQMYRECQIEFMRKEFDLAHRATMGVMPILPSAWGLSNCLRAARYGEPFEKWYAIGGSLRDSGHYRAVTRTLVLLAKAMGAKVPMPVYLKPNDFSPAAEWIARKRQQGVSCHVRGTVSSCVRVAAAALDKGLDIEGTVFIGGGEALTDAKRQTVESAGAQIFPTYFISEIGLIGFACRQMTAGNCVHIHRDSVAVISYRRKAPLSDFEVDSLLFTTLLPFSPRLLINAEMDDAGILGPAPCNCTYQKAGFSLQVGGIYSYGKMTGQGITLVGSDVVHILEERLPKRFGGAPGDYQLVEEETPRQTQIFLRVSPRVQAASADRIRKGFFEEVRRLYGGSLTQRHWQHTEALQVIFGEPFMTPSGKILPLHLLGTQTGGSRAS